MIEINRKEALRYLGYRQSIEGDLTEINSALDHCIEVLQKTAVPRHIVKRLPLTIENHTITIGDMVIHSKNLENNLKGCHAVYLFAATIGIEVDRLIKRTELTKMSDAVIYQAAGAAMIEAYCDEVNEELNQEAYKNNEFLKPRFSPGYGDLALDHQKDFMRILQMDKIGISLLESLLMVPSKSVTAVIGVSRLPRNCTVQGCEVCAKRDCAYRR